MYVFYSVPKAAAIHYINVCQVHKSRSELTVGAMPPLDLRAAKKSIFNKPSP